VNKAVKLDNRTTLKQQAASNARADFASLTKREQEVLARVVEGQKNKQISAALGITEAPQLDREVAVLQGRGDLVQARIGHVVAGRDDPHVRRGAA